jgi:uncharacterized protein (DUF924 family)
MNRVPEWQVVYDFWFPPGLAGADTQAHGRHFGRWFGGNSDAEVPPFAPLVPLAASRGLDAWLAEPRGRLSLILVLDQFPRSLFAGTPGAYAYDPIALRLAEAGLRNGQYDALMHPWEKTFFLLPLAHAEGPDHVERLRRVVALAEAIARDCPPHLREIYKYSANQARDHLAVVTRFGRFPHRNVVLERASTPAEAAYLAEGDFVHLRTPPWLAAGEGNSPGGGTE